MGKDKRHFKGANRGQAKQDRAKRAEEWSKTTGGNPDRKGNTGWSDMQMVNERFDAFYQAMHFVEDGEEWESFLKALRAPLPACFRINSDYAFGEHLANELNGYAGESISLEDGTKVPPVEQMKWYPGGYAYKLGADRRSIRKMEGLEALHKWMVRNTDNGHITRQEAVSMVPPLALDVQPHHKCLDMCAAPGSKTSQLLELVNKSIDSEQQGLVVANDADTDRAYMLVHQCRRINTPLLIITTHKGQMLPKMRNMAIPADTTMSADYFIKGGYFDRVLADVPCSGDGTLRKNPAIWGKWNVSGSMSLHALQISIATRGVQLLKTGGLLTYSTCSMSPYEDEASVAELLRNSNGTLELVDPREFLPLFKARPGLSTWYVLDDKNASKRAQKQRNYREERDAKFAASDAEKAKGNSAEDAPDAAGAGDAKAADAAPVADAKEGDDADAKPTHETHERIKTHDDPKVQAAINMGFDLYTDYEQVPPHLRDKIRKSLFPPTAEEAKWMHLERCMRCVPHDEDTGGFFVATLRKVEKANFAAKEEARAEHAAKRAATGENREATTTLESEPQGGSAAEAAADALASVNQKGLVDYAVWDKEYYETAKNFYGLDEVARPHDAFYTRMDAANLPGGKAEKGGNAAQGKPKGVFYFPTPTREILKCCDLKVVSAGIKVFERKKEGGGPGGSGEYRLCQDGIQALAPFMTKRVVQVTAQDMCNLLEGGLVSYSTLDAATVAVLTALERGPIVCTYKYNDADVVSAGMDHVKPAQRVPPLYIICSVNGNTRAMNVLCGKTDAESLRHSLQSMGVFREKVLADKPAAATTTAAASTSTAEAEAEAAAVVEPVGGGAGSEKAV